MGVLCVVAVAELELRVVVVDELELIIVVDELELKVEVVDVL